VYAPTLRLLLMAYGLRAPNGTGSASGRPTAAAAYLHGPSLALGVLLGILSPGYVRITKVLQ